MAEQCLFCDGSGWITDFDLCDECNGLGEYDEAEDFDNQEESK